MMDLPTLSLALICSFSCFGSTALTGEHQETVADLCPTRDEIEPASSGNGRKYETKHVAQNTSNISANQLPDEFSCPMHPEVKSKTPGKCPKCGMDLVPISRDSAVDYQLKLKLTPSKVTPKERVRLNFQIMNSQTGEQVTQFALAHEKLLHLFIISQDMGIYQHIHPDLKADGSFVIDTVFPQPGHYKLYADFQPVGGMPQILQRDVTTAEYRSDLFASRAHLTPDEELTKAVDGMNVELKIFVQGNASTEIAAGNPAVLKYYLKDAGTGKAVTDLEPYLGAWGHTLILSEDLSDYVHSHPTEQVYPGVVHRPNAELGWEVTFDAVFPHPGNYKVWTQFQRAGKVTTVSFLIRASAQVNADDPSR